MKPLEINPLGADFLHIDSVRNGIISEDCSQKDEAVGLKNCKNLIYKNGRLVTRPALSTTEESILDNSEFSEAPVNFRVTDIEFCFEGDTKRIVVENKFLSRCSKQRLGNLLHCRNLQQRKPRSKKQ